MKKFAIAVGILLVAAAIWGYNVLLADREPVSAAPGPAQIGRQKLHDQLVESEQREAEIERQDWSSVTLLHALIIAHQQRILKLTGNSEAGEIVAHDRDAAARLQKRINDLVAQESEEPETSSTAKPAAFNPGSGVPASGAQSPASPTTPAQPQHQR